MKIKEFWRWRLRSEITGRLYTSRYDMTEADAQATNPKAQRLPGSKQVQMVPENDDEAQRLRASSMMLAKAAALGDE